MKKAIVNPSEMELLEDIREVQTKLNCAWSFYNRISDEALICACIYEITALQTQYSHLLCRAKSELVRQSIAV